MKAVLGLYRIFIISQFSIFFGVQPTFAQYGDSTNSSSHGIQASGLTAVPGYQSATLAWKPARFSNQGSNQAGYLLIYATSTPLLMNSPNGMAPEYAVLNGTLVATQPVQLPSAPDTVALATGLTNWTMYQFLLIPYTWDGVDANTYLYYTPVNTCITIPPSSPGNINLSQISLTGNSGYSGLISPPATLKAPDGYVILYGLSYSSPSLVNGISYSPGQTIGTDTIVQVGKDTTFNLQAAGIIQDSNYSIFVFAYNLSGCTNLPIYSPEYASTHPYESSSPIPKQDTVDHIELQTTVIEPNPVLNNAWLRIYSSVQDRLDLFLYSAEGRLVKHTSEQVSAGVNKIDLSSSNLINGLYILKTIFHQNGKTATIPFIKQ